MKIFIVVVMMSLVIGTLARPSQNSGQYTGTDGKRLIKYSEAGPGEWFTPDEVNVLVTKNIGFMDITDHQIVKDSNPPKLFAIPTSVRFQSTVQAAITKLSTARMQEFLVPFSAYFNRYYTSVTGVDSSNWLYARIQNIINTTPYPGKVTVNQWTHTQWAQKSIVARIEGTNPSTPTEVIILGAHLDSVTSGANGQAPGADDNGSGSTTILEAFTALLESGFIPKTSIEFHWYAAEEGGLRGSQDIATNYQNTGVDIVAMTNFDMTGYLTERVQRRIGFVTDYTDPELNAFLRKVVEAYSLYTWMNRTCGYACSDHASWNRRGYRAAFPFEDQSNPNIHTVRDTISNIKFENILEFSKLAVGFAIETSQPSTSL